MSATGQDAADLPDAGDRPRGTNGQDRPVILIVDDTPASIWVLSETLASQHQTLFATNGPDCLRLAADKRPDLILLDVMMPDMDGYEVCSRLKADPDTSDIPVVFVTALGQEEDETKGFELGALDYITKPIKPAVVLARVRTLLLLRRQKAQLEDKQRQIEGALEAAGKIQESLLPGKAPAPDRADFAWKFAPCETLGGDIFNIVSLGEQRIGVYMLDVAGHGPPSALISVLVYQLMNPHTGVLVDRSASPPRVREPEEVLNILEEEFPLSRFDKHFTIVYLTVDLASGELAYSNAAHCPPVALRTDGSLETLGEAGTFIGLAAFPFGQGSLTLSPGDKVVLYSDGVLEMENANQNIFGLTRLDKTLREHAHAAPAELVQALFNRARDFAANAPLADDVSILAFEYRGPGPKKPSGRNA
ncbi:MAG: SpoIIE family protein phosphatase [Desulfovibrionaceae bacterium]|nr:SpoIIE family protein phosphatase [Desulfovibrionaceae bacterium]MBF0514162.1 SpoIIE family protein phosphatase [Desulfovibrionaceae bacterium]